MPPPAGGTHVLFIGNSLTYVNDLPRTLSELAASVGDTIRTSVVAYPDYALIDHWHTGSARTVLASARWDVVVMQQGPTSTTGLDRDTLLLAARAFADVIQRAGATPALYEVWPSTARLAFWDNTRDSYRLAAQAAGGLFMPAGEAWRIAWQQDASLAFHSSDGLHPTPLGTYVAALVIYERITGHDARQLPKVAVVEGLPLSVQPSVVSALQEAAHRANAENPARP